MKDNCVGDEFAPSFYVSEPKINAKEGDTINGDNMVNEFFVSDRI